MTTPFSSLPIIDLKVLCEQDKSLQDLVSLSQNLADAFSTTGFAYLTHLPLSFSHEDIFSLSRKFFNLPISERMDLAKKTFVSTNPNTYRGYFPTQPGEADNLKEGFELGTNNSVFPSGSNPGVSSRFDFNEPNVWPSEASFPGARDKLTQLHNELQALSSTLLSLLAVSLGKSPDHFSHFLANSLSTLRLLHYPPLLNSPSAASTISGKPDHPPLCCTPHTDSGILTLLYQDPTGGLEVRNARGEWIVAPYVPGSLVVNVGDLLAEMSGGRFVATVHQVRAAGGGHGCGLGRLSVPFFFEPGETCVVRSDGAREVTYGEHVRRKMGAWIEFQDFSPEARVVERIETSAAKALEAF